MAEEKGLQSLVSPRSRIVRGGEERMLEAQRLRKEQLESLYNMERPNIDYAQIAEDAYEGIKAMDTADQIALGTSFVPIVGDIAGGIADTRTLINDPSLTISAEVLAQHINQKDTFYLDMQNNTVDWLIAQLEVNINCPFISI